MAKAERKVFGRLQNTIEPPDLIEIQTKSYRDFLQADVPPAKRKEQGLQAIFNEIFPIDSFDGRYVLDFVKYQLLPPKHTYQESLYEGETYACPLLATFRLKDGTEIRDEDVFLGEIPLMTEDGAFVINGAERVIVSQLHRSPGISTERTVHANGQPLLSVRIIPDRGSWIEIMFDTNDVMWCFMDQRRRRRKFFATTLLRAFGYGSDESIMRLFYDFRKIDTGRRYSSEDLRNLVMKTDIVDKDSNAVIARRYDPLTPSMLEQAAAAGLTTVEVVDVSVDEGTLIKTLREDAKLGIHNEEDALKDIYKRMRPGDPPTPTNSKQMIHRLFFELAHYDLGYVGRYKINKKLGLSGKVPDELRTLHESGIEVIEAIRLLLKIFMGRDQVDDIDHLGNRRIRTTGELLENQCRVGLARTERLIRERMTIHDSGTQGPLTPQRLVNSKTFSAVVTDFFSRSQLSQFMDQTNPLSGLAHKRRLSALGPGGLSRERAGFEVRDVHPSHYGRICPIETPEGPNIGLISSLGIYARINRFGFIETPYRVVRNGKVTDQVDYLSADAEEQYVIAQANAPLKADKTFAEEKVTCRHHTEFCVKPAREVQYMDVAPMQVISIAAGLIPFLEHDDANRALMGANMMRQGVPLLRSERPYVGTGLEAVAARDSRVIVCADQPGIVAYVCAEFIMVTPDGELAAGKAKYDDNPEKGIRRYDLQKFRRCNAGTCFNQKPIVKKGQKVQPGDCLADGPATDQGELALGKNLLVAFMSWRGYNFEDAILVNERLVREDVLTSLHIVTYDCGARDTKLGPEEITRDIPNVGEDALKNLGPDGIVRVGAEVHPGDILVGKVTPKGETELSPEERLLRAIFGEKAADVRDTSLVVPPGTTGVVMAVKVTTTVKEASRPAAGDDAKPTRKQMRDAEKKRKEQRVKLETELVTALSNVLLNEKLPVDVVNSETQELIVPASKKITKSVLSKLAKAHATFQIEPGPAADKVESVIAPFRARFAELEDAAAAAEGAEQDDLADLADDGTVVKSVRVYLVDKKNLSVGDKMAGRHGNKGCISRILPSCDMPFLPDGTPVDIVLNPLGVPSRMNLGQLFETYLGLACRLCGFHAATPVFDGVQESEIDAALAEARKVQEKEEGSAAWINTDGKTVLYDGLTGEPFAQRVVVGVIYMLKLHHLVTDKIHARATGPYSLVTQQPLGGKAQLGGQRMGEMEVWALEAYGVAYALQELLTVKSDDVQGRTRIYESIVKGQNVLDSGMPESFSVLIHELRGLCLDMQLLGGDTDKPASRRESAASTGAAQLTPATDSLLGGVHF
ncbi:MAG: DNA-directed RNA polymerase subunit beta [Kiritimatiellae bacterium]|nr:DNA-directed RNA polymerase subunit beta [Kiritimatiellia bacterium]